MKKQEIIKGNKLISKFIGLTPHNMFPDELTAPFGFEWMAVSINTRYSMDKEIKNEMEYYKYFKFNSSWDWLMPVVEKIFNLTISTHNYPIDVTIKQGFCLFSYFDGSYVQTIIVKSIDRKDGETTIECIWLAVVDFIIWYNKEWCNK